ncbi:testican-1-like [Crotalus adamanteus]|uniref:Testican-1-like n=1 Tax=Crotalus adamanteus TaxID=8729 RepID=A0AAW1BWP8_CROAD
MSEAKRSHELQRGWPPSRREGRGQLEADGKSDAAPDSEAFRLKMYRILAVALWCFLQAEGRHPEITLRSSNNGNFLDNDKWLSTVSQYDKDKYWNKFRDVS